MSTEPEDMQELLNPADSPCESRVQSDRVSPGWQEDTTYRVIHSATRETCLRQHPLDEYEAVAVNMWICDVCNKNIPSGEKFWGCQECAWVKCSSCLVNGLQLGIGSHVEITESLTGFALDNTSEEFEVPAGVTGTILSVQPHADPQSEGGMRPGAHVRVALHCCSTRKIFINRSDFLKLAVIDAPRGKAGMLIITVLLVGLLVYGIADEKRLGQLLKKLIRWCRTLGLLAPVLIWAVSVVLPIIMLPVFPIMALSGPLFTEMYGSPLVGGAVAFLAVNSGLWLGSVAAFALGKTVFRTFAEKANRESLYLRRLNRIIETGGTKIVLMARALPILPAEVFDYACALTKLRIWQYAIGCLGSSVPVAFWTFSSAQAAAAAHGQDKGDSKRSHMMLIAINIAVLAILTAVIAYTIKHQDAKHITERHPTMETARHSVVSITRSVSTLSGSLSDEAGIHSLPRNH